MNLMQISQCFLLNFLIFLFDLKQFSSIRRRPSLPSSVSNRISTKNYGQNNYKRIDDSKIFAGNGKNSSKVVWIEFDSPAFQSEDLELICRYRLESSKKLYSIKWFKDDEEFAQYMPNDQPEARFYSNRIFSRRTNQHTHQQLQHPEYEIGDGIFRIFLKNINLKFQGVYGWNFVLKSRVDLNCTSPKSKPVSIIRWLINNEPAPNDYLIHYNQINHSDGLHSKTVRLKFLVNEDHYKLGHMRLECIAIYRRLKINRTKLSFQSKWDRNRFEKNHQNGSVIETSIIESGAKINCSNSINIEFLSNHSMMITMISILAIIFANTRLPIEIGGVKN
ncbi:synaptic vesicular amine transporter-like [Sarcoptes scabiei]|nr:synaptic vesicular amine transporter-like [Sarcoptes scabiei]